MNRFTKRPTQVCRDLPVRTLMRRMQNGIHLDLAWRESDGSPTAYSWYDALGCPERWRHFASTAGIPAGTIGANPSATIVAFDYAYDRAGRQMPTDHASDVGGIMRVAGMPSMNRLIKPPIQARRGLPAGV